MHVIVAVTATHISFGGLSLVGGGARQVEFLGNTDEVATNQNHKCKVHVLTGSMCMLRVSDLDDVDAEFSMIHARVESQDAIPRSS